MDSLALPAQSEDGPAAWSISGLRLAVELSKEFLSAQAQRKQLCEQRAFQLIPFCAGLLGVIVTLTYGGKFAFVGDTYLYLWLTSLVLLLGIVLALASIMLPEWGYSGMEPKEALYRYTADGGEHGLLRAVSDEYQRRIEMNKGRLRMMSRLVNWATSCAALGLLYGALMIVASQYGGVPFIGHPPQQQAAPHSPAPETAPAR